MPKPLMKLTIYFRSNAVHHRYIFHFFIIIWSQPLKHSTNPSSLSERRRLKEAAAMLGRLFSQISTAASLWGLPPGRPPSSSSILHPWQAYTCLNSSSSLLPPRLRSWESRCGVMRRRPPRQVVRCKEARVDGRHLVFDLLDSTSVLNLGVVLMAAKAVDWWPRSAMTVNGSLLSAVVGAGRRRWLFWAWASHNRMWTSAGMPWLARVSAWAAKAFGLAVLKVDWPDGGISIGYYYPTFFKLI